ncbi:MAG: hypothetical protein ACLQVJ_24005 [Syntrophobacteraceae bacterium]
MSLLPFPTFNRVLEVRLEIGINLRRNRGEPDHTGILIFLKALDYFPVKISDRESFTHMFQVHDEDLFFTCQNQVVTAGNPTNIVHPQPFLGVFRQYVPLGVDT